jgi:hypothetical protein
MFPAVKWPVMRVKTTCVPPAGSAITVPKLVVALSVSTLPTATVPVMVTGRIEYVWAEGLDRPSKRS